MIQKTNVKCLCLIREKRPRRVSRFMLRSKKPPCLVQVEEGASCSVRPCTTSKRREDTNLEANLHSEICEGLREQVCHVSHQADLLNEAKASPIDLNSISAEKPNRQSEVGQEQNSTQHGK